MKAATVLGYALFFATLVGVVVWSTYSKYQNGVGIIYSIKQHGLDVPALIGLAAGGGYLIYAWLLKDNGDSK